jgi:pimeloyl-ACP methyl ester carboxylesterase
MIMRALLKRTPPSLCWKEAITKGQNHANTLARPALRRANVIEATRCYGSRHTKDVAFIVSLSAAGVPHAEQEKYDQINRLRAKGHSEEALKKADDFLELQFDAARSRAGWDRLQVALPAAQGQIWASRSFAFFPKEHWIWDYWRKNVDFDSAPVLQKTRCPLLMVFGERDPHQPVQKGVSRAEQALQAGRNKDYSIKVIPNANHALQVPDANNRLIVAPDLETMIADWIVKQVKVAR